MKSLIIGAAGFVGDYLIKELSLNHGWDVSATKLPFETLDNKNCAVFDLDILDEQAIVNLIAQEKPDIVYHLAAQSSVAVSWLKPALTIDVNIKGASNLLESVRKLDYKPRVILIGSGEEYGAVSASNCPIKETLPADPQNIYAVTKHTQNLLGSLYAKAYNLDIISTRAFNHIGPGQSPQFVVADFCKQAAEITRGEKDPVIYVGNLGAKRDFTDVRDVVRAYALLGINGKTGETYNVGSGNALEIGVILERILELSDRKIAVQVDSKKFRPVDVPIIVADITKIRQDTGWKAEIPLGQTLKDVFDHFLTGI